MNRPSRTTTIVLQTVNAPDRAEVEALLDGLLASAENYTRCEPLRAQAIFPVIVSATDERASHVELMASRVVNDGSKQAHWESHHTPTTERT